MQIGVIVGVSVLAATVLGLLTWRLLDHQVDDTEIRRLITMQPTHPARFTYAMLAGLPEPAQRYFRYAIAEGTPLYTVAQLSMRGQFSLGTKEKPNYMAMEAREVLAAPEGFVWTMSGRSGVMHLSGSDSGTWTRFWLAGLIPVARFGNNPDHARSAFGRYVAEAIFWTPAALLPGPDVHWELVNHTAARVIVRHGDLEQAVELTVAEDGRPVQVVFLRWSDANPEKRHRLQPFGGVLSAFREFQGFRLPTHVEAGNHFGTQDYFPFFIVDVTAVRFAAPEQQR